MSSSLFERIHKKVLNRLGSYRTNFMFKNTIKMLVLFFCYKAICFKELTQFFFNKPCFFPMKQYAVFYMHIKKTPEILNKAIMKVRK